MVSILMCAQYLITIKVNSTILYGFVLFEIQIESLNVLNTQIANMKFG